MKSIQMPKQFDEVKPEINGLPGLNYYIRDSLENISAFLKTYLSELTGGWLFGDIEALLIAGYHVEVFLLSKDEISIMHVTRASTGTSIFFLCQIYAF